MKLAKKVLATVMAVAMIFALSALAFAAGTPTAVLETAVEDGQVYVTVYFKDAIGLKSWDLDITYDATVLQFSYNDAGKDAAQVGLTKSNTYTEDLNADTAGLIKWSGYFKTELTDKATFAGDAKKKSDKIDINSDYFEAAIFVFDVINEAATSTAIKAEVTNKGGVELVGSNATATLKEEEPSSEAASQETPSSEEASSVEEGSKEAQPDKGPKTDASTWAIGAAAAVAVLAGAAFVVSKKRK